MIRFQRDEQGYALVLTLLFMPVFMGLSLMIIDLGRGSNAHSDLQAAADAVALAGAAELDGGADAIVRAKAAMSELYNGVNFLGLEPGDQTILLNYTDDNTDAFNVIFLRDIPDSDDDPIDQAFVDANATTSGLDAEYVYVAAQSKNLDTIFPVPMTYERGDVPIQATAVAGRNAAACNITPLFICNPFEGQVEDLHEAFAAGKLYGRQIRMHPGGQSTSGPGNFGYLSIPDGNGTKVLKDFFAEDSPAVCYNADEVTTKPGASTSVGRAINVRLDHWGPGFKNNQDDYRPSKNVRKGYGVEKKGGSDPKYCDAELIQNPPAGYESYRKFMGFPDNGPFDGSAVTGEMRTPGELGGIAGAYIGEGDWDIDRYFEINHGAPPSDAQLTAMNSFPTAAFPGSAVPSRYDVYRYEIEQTEAANGIDMLDPISNTYEVLDLDNQGNVQFDDQDPPQLMMKTVFAEAGNPMCSQTTENALPTIPDPDRRVIQAAIIDCSTYEHNGRTTFPVKAYASVFLTNPVEVSGNPGSGPSDPGDEVDGTIGVEIIDITGNGGLGTLDNYIRVESLLVR